MQYVRLLFWLKWKLLLRGYRRSKTEWIGGLLLLFVFLPIAIVIAAFFGYHFFHAGPPENENWLRGSLLIIYAFWIVIPILGYSLNDSYDISKLFVYPLSMRQIFAGTIAGSLMDRPTVLLLPTFVAILIGFTREPIAAMISIVALALFLLHTLALSQAILMAGAGLFQSRKFRDAAVVLLPLVWVLYYMRFVVARQARYDRVGEFVHSPTWNMVSYLPHGWAARSIYAAYRGDYSAALIFLAGMAVIAYATFALAGWTLQRIYSGETAIAPANVPTVLPAQRESKTPFTVAKSQGSRLWSIMPDWTPRVIRAIADKEFRYLVRDPYYKMVLVNLLWPLLLPIFLALRGHSGDSAGAESLESGWLVWIGPAMMTFSQMKLTFNIYGTEGGAIGSLFLFPASRRQIVLGKNVFHFTVLSCLNIAMTAIVYVLSRDLGLTALLFYWMELALLLNLSLGNVFSIYFPTRAVMRGWRVQSHSSGEGCFYFMFYLAVLVASLLLFIPVAAAIAVPMRHLFDVDTLWLALSLPFGAIYVLSIYYFSLYLSDLLLPRREEPIIAKVSQEP